MAVLEDVLDKDCVRWFLIKQKHTYHEELVIEINTQYPNLKGCSLRTVKGFVIAKESGKECQFWIECLISQHEPPYQK